MCYNVIIQLIGGSSMNEEEVLFGKIETSNVLELWFDEEEES